MIQVVIHGYFWYRVDGSYPIRWDYSIFPSARERANLFYWQRRRLFRALVSLSVASHSLSVCCRNSSWLRNPILYLKSIS